MSCALHEWWFLICSDNKLNGSSALQRLGYPNKHLNLTPQTKGQFYFCTLCRDFVRFSQFFNDNTKCFSFIFSSLSADQQTSPCLNIRKTISGSDPHSDVIGPFALLSSVITSEGADLETPAFTETADSVGYSLS